MRIITQFMWGYQPHFRSSAKVTIHEALHAIGVPSDPVVYLIGFRSAAESERLPICVEPERGRFSPGQLADVEADAKGRYDEHENRNVIHSDAGMHEQYHRRLRDQCRADALAAAMETLDPVRVYYVSPSVTVERHEVHTVVAIEKDLVESLPRLSRTDRSVNVTHSLLDALIFELQRRACRGLLMPEPGAGLNALDGESDEIIRAALRHLLDSIVLLAGGLHGARLLAGLEALSTQPYEGRAGAGAMIIARRDHPALSMSLELRDAVSLTEGRAVRKLLEMTGDRMSLLTDGDVVFGLGAVAMGYDAAAEDLYSAHVVGRGAWELRHGEDVLVRVTFGRPALPEPPLSEGRFKDTASRTLTGPDVDRLWSLAQEATQALHGTMLVVAQDAATETERLRPQATPIQPKQLEPGELVRLASIDGAIMLDPRGACHAVGVILDGAADGAGDPSRGARYNSGVRYANGRRQTLVIVVSEDGSIDLLPSIPPRVDRRIVEAAVGAVLNAAKGDPPEFEPFFDAWRVVEKLAFYLSQEECDALNHAHTDIEERRNRLCGMRIGFRRLVPDPRMNDEYFLGA